MFENLKKVMERNREAVSYRLGKSRMERKIDQLTSVVAFATALFFFQLIVFVTIVSYGCA